MNAKSKKTSSLPPWWLGLIAGQMASEKVTPTDYYETNKDELRTTPSKLEKFFSQIWDKLSEECQNILIYLAESSRPLSVDELSWLLKINFKNTNKYIKKLNNISLITEHSISKKYHVHPLVRQFIQKKYNSDFLQVYIDRLLESMMGRQLFNIIFRDDFSEGDLVNIVIDSQTIIDAIETCLNSDENSKALQIIACYYRMLSESKCISEILSLSDRVLKAIDWDKEKIPEVKYKATFLSNYLDLLTLQDNTSDLLYEYLTLYEKYCPHGTIPYTCFLSTKAYVMWRIGEYNQASDCLSEYDELVNKCSEEWNISDLANLRGMILREQGYIDDAIKIFNENVESSVKYGNLAKCYIAKEEYEQALKYITQSVYMLYETDSLANDINKGYAFLWIAEIYYKLGDEERAKSFLISAQEIWKEYAPYLLKQTHSLMKKLEKVDIFSKIDLENQLLTDLYSTYLAGKSA